jgi:hypothetical protein
MGLRRELVEGFDLNLRGAGAQVAWDLKVSLGVSQGGWKVLWDPELWVDHYPAPRFDPDGRRTKSPDAVRDLHHNEMYVLLSTLSPIRALTVASYRLFLGTAHAPGLILLAGQMLRSPNRATFNRFLVATSGRLQGLFTSLGVRRRQAMRPVA